jgi:hypothetical protein
LTNGGNISSNRPVLGANSVKTAANPGSQQSDATTRRKQRDAQVQSITDRRLTIQFAADAEWPYTVDANAGIRGEFFLPLSQPFHG